MRVWYLLPLMIIGLIAFRFLASFGLDNRCISLYSEVVGELETAQFTFADGKSAEAVLDMHTSNIEKLAIQAAELREDLAEAGERHQWEWPPVIRAKIIGRYDKALTGVATSPSKAIFDIPNELVPLFTHSKSAFSELRWFCNRAISANMPEFVLEDNAWQRLQMTEMRTNEPEILKAIKTQEELTSFNKYRAKYSR